MGYYISPRFLDKLSVHITKNYLNLPNVKVPLILGVHGRKGEGKTFQCELVFERMGVEAIHISAGELESPDAGDPARLLRLRYREANEFTKVRGKMAIIMINDIDAGAGRVDEYTQYTVNTQLVNATLMNIADNPTNVQLPGSYDDTPLRRIPIIVTGNDFSTLYAPMIRDGRMEKFFWEPNQEDRLGIVSGIFEVDQVAKDDVARLVEAFPDQAIDFYSALRSRLYDEQVRDFIHSVGLDRVSSRVVNPKDPLPEFRKPDFSLPHLLAVGEEIVREQKRIQELRLSEEYNKSLFMSRKLGDTTPRGGKGEGNRGQGEGNRGKGEGEGRGNGGNGEAIDPASSEQFFRAYNPATSNGQPHLPHHPIPPSSPYSPTPHTPHPTPHTSYPGQPASTTLTPDMVTEVNNILNQGHRLGIEFVDNRRFRTGSWTNYGTFQGNGAEAIAALESCLAEHTNDYVRLVGVDTGNRRRVLETVIHRPGKLSQR
ncbi:ribulose bisphosphate carboxylase small subunit [Kovacikia minuta CCNUW1]|uniref:ribulose bisphosphate carboxylase small subunit n=1 Tax=Kovacikia minuta TaxID=2931930 RepID=UPI001CCC0634|nr:ribulose bisphosphate carboxylase small subunit [Kovacikia minuta]UBF28781.1 ribulose bisphosphate carboxylase small subunit [Kovacikia minuta CCNUW1]